MAIVITNGTHYIRFSKTGGIKYTKDISEAFAFSSVSEAISKMKKAPSKTKGYMVTDTLTNHVLWKWMTSEDINEMRRNKLAASMIRRDENGKIIRKIYSHDARKLIYNNAHGRCELCGRKILFDDMTIDHIKPLSMGGEDEVENLACTCYPCNLFKGNILPDDFIERVTEIFLYQMEKKYNNRFIWRRIHRALRRMV